MITPISALDYDLQFVHATSSPCFQETGLSFRSNGFNALYNGAEVGSCFVEKVMGDYNFLALDIDKGNFPIRGKDIFEGLYENSIQYHNIDGIWGNWVQGKKADNLNSFNSLLEQGISESYAALQTFTGKMVSRKGFVDPRVITGVFEEDKSYRSVRVLFLKEYSEVPFFLDLFSFRLEDF